MQVVSNTSPINNLAAISELDLLVNKIPAPPIKTAITECDRSTPPLKSDQLGTMKIYIIEKPATLQQVEEMLSTLQVYIKLAVDIDRGILAGGGAMHADCEQVLLNSGSQQANIWGADWNPKYSEVTYESLINIRPSQNNRSMTISDPAIRQKIEKIVRNLLDIS